MKNILFLFLCSINLLFAQNLNLDSLKKVRNYAKIELPDSLGFRLVSPLEGYDIFSLEGAKVNTEIYEELTEVGYGYANAVNMRGQQYLLDRNGKILFSHEYDEIKAWREGIFEVEIEGKHSIINAENKQLMGEFENFDYILPLYNVNSFANRDFKTLFSEDYGFYPCDSFIVKVEDTFFLYNFQNEQVLKLSFDADFLAGFRQHRSCVGNTSYEVETFLVQGNKIILQDNYTRREEAVWIEWTIDGDTTKRKYPRFSIENHPYLRHFYMLSELEEIDKETVVYHAIIDETGKKVLDINHKIKKDRWGGISTKRIIDFREGYIIERKELVGVIDTSYQNSNTQETVNPLRIESCKQEKDIHWQWVYALTRLADQKEILQAPPFSYDFRLTEIRGLNFFGKDKCVVIVNKKTGITDLEGKWLVPPIYDEASFLDNTILQLRLGDSLFLMNTDLQRKNIDNTMSIEAIKGELFYTQNEVKGIIYPEDAQKKLCSITVWKGFTPIHSLVCEYDVNRPYAWSGDIYIAENIFWKTNRKGEKLGIILFLADGKQQFYPISDEEDIKIDKRTYPYHYILKVKKWGVMDKSGKQIIDFAYDYVAFCGNYYACYKGKIVDYRDKKGNLLFTKPLIPAYQKQLASAKVRHFSKQNGYEISDFEEIISLEEGDFASYVYFRKGKAYYTESQIYGLHKFSLYGYINEKGQEVVPPIYTKVVKMNATTIIATNANGCDKINLLTQEKQHFPFEEIRVEVRYKIAKKDGLWAFIDDNFVPTSEFMYKEVGEWLKNKYLWVKDKNSKQGLISLKDHQILIPLKYEQIRSDNYNRQPIIWLATYQKEKKTDVYSPTFLFVGTYEKVKDANSKYFIAQKNGKWGVVNYKRETIVPFMYENDEDIQLYHKGAIAKKMTEQHWYSYLGKRICTINENATTVEWKGWYCVEEPSTSEKAGFVSIFDAKGEVKFSYKGNLTILQDANYLIAYFSETQKMNLLDSNLQKVFAKDYREIRPNSNKMFVLADDKKMGIADSVGNILLAPEKSLYEYISFEATCTNCKYLALAKLDKKEVYIRLNGSLVFPNNYDFYKIQSPNCCTVSQNGKAGCIDSLGNVLVPLEWENVSLSEKNNEIYAARQECDYYLLDKNGQKIVADAYDTFYPLRFDDNQGIIMQKGDKKGLILPNGKQLLECKYDEIEITNSFKPYYFVSIGEQVGIFYKEGKEILPPIYHTPTLFSLSSGFILLEKDSLWGCFYPQTAEISEIKYKKIEIEDNKDFLIATLQDGKMVLIDKNGKNVFPKSYEKIEVEKRYTREDIHPGRQITTFAITDMGRKYCYYFQYGKWNWEVRED